MDTLADLEKEKNNILSKISLAASEGKTDLVLSESQRLEKIELLINRYEQIILELEELRTNKLVSPSTATSVQHEVQKKDNQLQPYRPLQHREIGNKIRMNFLKKLEKEGIRLQSIRGKTIYQTKAGKRVGIAVATERQPDRWFLGLPIGAFDYAVLLCQRENGEVFEMALSEKFFKKYGQTMSQSKGQMKFNIVKRGSRLLVQVPGTVGISGTFLSNDYSFLL